MIELIFFCQCRVIDTITLNNVITDGSPPMADLFVSDGTTYGIFINGKTGCLASPLPVYHLLT